jgi:SAM-dependent methyltransferase
VSDSKPAGSGPSTTAVNSRVVARWDERATARAIDHLQGWLDSPLVFGEIFQARVSGDPHVHWLEGLMTRAGIPKSGHWASLGCGTDDEEIKAAKLSLCDRLSTFDASRASLDLARRAAAEAGVTNLMFETIDLDRFSLPAGAFDVVMMNMSLHHVSEIRVTFEAVRRALAPYYKGFRWTDPDLEHLAARRGAPRRGRDGREVDVGPRGAPHRGAAG